MNLAFHFDFRKSYISNEAVQLEIIVEGLIRFTSVHKEPFAFASLCCLESVTKRWFHLKSTA